MLTANIPRQTLKEWIGGKRKKKRYRTNIKEKSQFGTSDPREKGNTSSGSPAHKVPRRSEQVSHEKDMFRFRYGADFSHFPSRA